MSVIFDQHCCFRFHTFLTRISDANAQIFQFMKRYGEGGSIRRASEKIEKKAKKDKGENQFLADMGLDMKFEVVCFNIDSQIAMRLMWFWSETLEAEPFSQFAVLCTIMYAVKMQKL